MMAKEEGWPYGGQAPSRVALSQTADGLLNSGRSLAGPLRRGTAGPVGPTGRALGSFVRGASDFGLDRVSPRPFDSIGQKYPEGAPASRRIGR